MKSILVVLFLYSINSFAQQKCESAATLYEKAKEEAYDVMPQELEQAAIEVDFNQTEICIIDNEVVINAEDTANEKHLVYAGLFLGYGLIGIDGSMTRLDSQGRYRDHFRVMTHYIPNLWIGAGVQYGKHIKGSIFFYGANANYLRTYNDKNNIAVGPIAGVNFGKGRVNAHAHIGARAVYETDFGFEFMPQIGAGVRIRLFKK